MFDSATLVHQRRKAGMRLITTSVFTLDDWTWSKVTCHKGRDKLQRPSNICLVFSDYLVLISCTKVRGMERMLKEVSRF